MLETIDFEHRIYTISGGNVATKSNAYSSGAKLPLPTNIETYSAIVFFFHPDRNIFCAKPLFQAATKLKVSCNANAGCTIGRTIL